MNFEEYRQLIHIVQGEYKSKYGTKAATLAFERIKDCTSAQLGRAVDKVVTAHTHLPPIDRIVTATLAEQEKDKQSAIIEREDDAARDKREMQQGTYRAFQEDKGCAKAALMVIRAMLTGKMTRWEALDAIRKMDSLYPSAGFATEGAKLAGHYEKHGMNPADRCGNNSVPAA